MSLGESVVYRGEEWERVTSSARPFYRRVRRAPGIDHALPEAKTAQEVRERARAAKAAMAAAADAHVARQAERARKALSAAPEGPVEAIPAPARDPAAIRKAILTLSDGLRRYSIAEIIAATCDVAGMSRADFLEHCRTRNRVHWRHAAIHVAARLTTASLPMIGRAFGGRDHSTVFNSLGNVRADLPMYQDKIDAILARLGVGR